MMRRMLGCCGAGLLGKLALTFCFEGLLVGFFKGWSFVSWFIGLRSFLICFGAGLLWMDGCRLGWLRFGGGPGGGGRAWTRVIWRSVGMDFLYSYEHSRDGLL